jgi:flagellar motor switch protein FliN/FliY
MAFMDQNSVDALLSQVQADAEAVKKNAAPGDAGLVAKAAQSVADAAGDIAGSAEGSAAAATPASTAAPAPAAPAPAAAPEVHRLLAIEVPVIVQLGMRRLTVGEVMRLGVGAIVEFNKSAEEELDLLANNKPIGKGHAVKVGENFGIKISSISPVKETIRKLGGI